MSNSVAAKARRDIPFLRTALEELVCIAGDVMTEGGEAPCDDHLAFMAYVFLSKQLDHAVAVLRLDDHPDAQLIARSMLEGRVQLLWAAQDPQQRALLWREFAAVVDWRTIRDHEARGEYVDEETRQDVLRRISTTGEKFRRRSSTSADPYRREWHPLTSVRAMFEATDSMPLYVGLYGPLSEWHHWSPSGPGRALSQADGTFVYRASSESGQATALAAAFQCLHDTAAVADHVLHLGIGAQLTGLCERYLARLDPLSNKCGRGKSDGPN